MTQKKPSAELLADPNITRWYRNTQKSSVISAEINLRGLARFCSHVKLTPDQYAKMPIEKMEDIAQDLIDELESQKKPSGEQLYSPSRVLCSS